MPKKEDPHFADPLLHAAETQHSFLNRWYNIYKQQAKPAKQESKLGKFFSIIGTVIMILVIVFCLGVTLPKFFGLSSYVVVSGSMEPAIPVNSLIYVKACEPAELAEGDVILFYDSKDGMPVTHRVVENDQEGQKILTKGDANNGIDMRPALYANIAGRVVTHIPGIGAVAGALSSVMGKIAAAMILVAGYILTEIGRRLSRKNT